MLSSRCVLVDSPFSLSLPTISFPWTPLSPQVSLPPSWSTCPFTHYLFLLVAYFYPVLVPFLIMTLYLLPSNAYTLRARICRDFVVLSLGHFAYIILFSSTHRPENFKILFSFTTKSKSILFMLHIHYHSFINGLLDLFYFFLIYMNVQVSV